MSEVKRLPEMTKENGACRLGKNGLDLYVGVGKAYVFQQRLYADELCIGSCFIYIFAFSGITTKYIFVLI